ncbi:protein of unknown function [Cupriavidus neocaledonicus]|uniref:Uncharacterized protein n=1 Tax=Cupriavidus neocaledonicus TaxID=1040979 RepID=A0A375H7X0_9BURK|nr:hypothetical protein CBM2605_A240086 [Cupriavidus neocaledonicus]SPD48081.1 protein of unknown function [Cupriavidus neocaledonicus]
MNVMEHYSSRDRRLDVRLRPLKERQNPRSLAF